MDPKIESSTQSPPITKSIDKLIQRNIKNTQAKEYTTIFIK